MYVTIFEYHFYLFSIWRNVIENAPSTKSDDIYVYKYAFLR